MRFKGYCFVAAMCFGIAGCSSEGDSDALLQAITLADLNATAIRISTVEAVEVLSIGETVQLQAEALDSLGMSTGDVTSIVSWQSNNSAVSVNDAGLLTANSVTGVVAVEVTASLAQITVDSADRIQLSVSDAELVGVDINASTLIMDECQLQTLVANGIYDDNGDDAVTGDMPRIQALDVTWTTDALSSVATIPSSSAGVVNAFSAGTPNVTATSTQNNMLSATETLTINDSLSLLTIDQSDFDLALGASSTLSVTGTFNTGDSAIPNTLATWVSDNAQVTVSASGVVTTQVAETGNISASCGGVMSSTTVAVSGEEYSIYRVVVEGTSDTEETLGETNNGTNRTFQLVMQGSIDGGATFDDLDEDLVDWEEVSDVSGFSINSEGEVTVPPTFPDDRNQYQVEATFTRPAIDEDERFTFTLNQ